ncbi:MAG: glycerol-3-phosphate dehydrogenase [Pseudomonadota bacterium]|nr:glycerol-3-phosphate dehydrogenase [Pseudomonadota bacterium]
MNNETVFDLLIIGGGINGTAIARDASGRGLKVMLVEQGDLASGTSSKSTKLIHGGLRYLEYYDFKLVREALIEREVLLNAAPHIIWPLRFVLPYHEGLRPKWMIRLGLFLYDHLGGRKILPPTKSLDLTTDAAGLPLREDFTTGYEYSDCWVEDSRLVALNAMDAKEKGAVIATRTRCLSATQKGSVWMAELQGGAQVQAKVLINASGPWVSQVLSDVVLVTEQAKIRLVKGSHIVLSKLYEHDRCYIFQNTDGRIFFAIPYERDFTLIGTTDEDYHGPLGPVEISDHEIEYLLSSAGAYFRKPLKREMLRWTYAGVRPLYDDGAGKAQSATREYVLKLEGDAKGPQMLSVFGGKITTSRKLAEEAMAKLAPLFPSLKPKWTADAKLPGGMAYNEVADYLVAAKKRYSFLKPQEIERLFYTYGKRLELILGDARFAIDLGEHFGPLLAREVDYMKANEWAQTSEDILWRRTKLGLHMSETEIAALKTHMGESKATPKKKKT